MFYENLVLIDLENVNFDYVIKNIDKYKEAKIYAFGDFSKFNLDGNLFYEHKIHPIQVYHQKNKKNDADFVLLRYAYQEIFTNLGLKNITLFSGDGDFFDLVMFAKNKNMNVEILSNNNININLKDNVMSNNINSNKKKININKIVIDFEKFNTYNEKLLLHTFLELLSANVLDSNYDIDKQVLFNNFKNKHKNNKKDSLHNYFPNLNKTNLNIKKLLHNYGLENIKNE
ncbi:NYN domain-containing protein [Campylobacter sp. MG1]|uniref:NYN domain-containing protein n=1 Tax=Campylobacter sp. MG1 TaxID=2976332 RepID=UPI00226C9E49|nr:NYN domain-containing protein [Campylobacter sp. MG1]